MLDAQIEIAPHRNSPLSLIMADIDHFKKINDNFGHLIGDEILRLVASTISQNVKGRDIVARYGGEEFAVILPDTTLDNALIIALQIKQKLETQKWILRQRKEAIGNITASFGVAQYLQGEKKAKFLQRADEMLYEAKNAGRNRVVG
jgi:diguanylate cyclase